MSGGYDYFSHLSWKQLEKDMQRRTVEGYLRKHKWVKATRFNSPLYWQGYVAGGTGSESELEQLDAEFISMMEIHGRPSWLKVNHPLWLEARKNLGFHD